MILPLRLQPLLSGDDSTIASDSIPYRHRVLGRQIGLYWFREMEEIHQNVAFGTRLLIHRDTRNGIITDHVTTRVSRDTLYGNWTHQTVIYHVNEVTPYPYDLDCFHSREDLLAIHSNQFPREGHPNMVAGELPTSFPRLVRLSNHFEAQFPVEIRSPPELRGVRINPLPEGESMWVDEDENPLIFPLSPMEGMQRLSSNALLSRPF